MEFELEGKVALVTGSSRGIGRGIALTLAAEGCDLMVTGRDGAALQEVARTAARSGVSVHTHRADLREPDAPAALAAAVAREYGRLDVLVNNAGATRRGDFLALNDEDWQDGFALKLFAHVRLTRALWPMLSASQGSIVTIAGSGARMPGRGVRHRRFGQCGLRRLQQGAVGARQDRRRTGERRQSRGDGDRTVCPPPRRLQESDRPGRADGSRRIPQGAEHHPLRNRRRHRGARGVHRLAARAVAARRDGRT